MCPEVFSCFSLMGGVLFLPLRGARAAIRRAAGAAAAMALCTLSEDEQRILFVQLCNVLEPRLVTTSSTNPGLH